MLPPPEEGAKVAIGSDSIKVPAEVPQALTFQGLWFLRRGVCVGRKVAQVVSWGRLSRYLIREA
jgi:hypothetical protein